MFFTTAQFFELVIVKFTALLRVRDRLTVIVPPVLYTVAPLTFSIVAESIIEQWISQTAFSRQCLRHPSKFSFLLVFIYVLINYFDFV